MAKHAEKNIGKSPSSLFKSYIQDCLSLNFFKLTETAAIITGNKRMADCGRYSSGPTIMRGIKSAFFRGVNHCGLTHICPRCGLRISASREKEIKIAELKCEELGGKSALLTLTVPHAPGEQLSNVLLRLDAVKKKMSNLRSWRRLNEVMFGHITSWEIVHNVNGWHPHVHMLLFFRPNVDIPAKKVFRIIWYEAAKRANVLTHFLYGAHLSSGGKYAAYICGRKSRAQELDGSRSYIDILVDYSKEHDSVDAVLLNEYSQATTHRKKLVWSKGLRNLIGLGIEKSESKLLTEIGSLSFQEWRAVYYTQSRDIILKAAFAGGRRAVKKEMVQILKRFEEKYNS